MSIPNEEVLREFTDADKEVELPATVRRVQESRHMKKITYNDIISGKRFTTYQEEAEYILALIRDGKIKPIQSSPKNGKYPALYTRYWLLSSENDDSEYIEELRCTICTSIDIDYYLKHIDTYIRERAFVIQLSDYLNQNRDKLSVCISENERSFEIWKKEKFLSGKSYDGVSAGDVLKHCGLTKEFLNIYRTAEPLAYYTASKETPQNILILENLDPFYSMRKYLLSGQERICGIPIGTLIYGGGKRIARAFDDFEIFAEPYMVVPKEEENHFFYVGDLDYEGIAIYESLAKRQREYRRIDPCMEIYNRMLDKVLEYGRAGERKNQIEKTELGGQNDQEDKMIQSLPQMKNQNRIDITSFASDFTDTRKTLLGKILAAGRYVPQEILSVTDYECELGAVDK